MSKRMYRLKIYDNFHYMDEDETYMHGAFSSYEEALQEAKLIVENHIIHNYKPGMLPEAMSADYTMFGEDPVIVSELWQEHNRRFSAWNYTSEFAERYYEEQKR